MEYKGTAIVVDSGHIYSSSETTANELGATKYETNADFGRQYGGKYENGVKVNIVNYKSDYYLIEKDGQEWLIDKNGLSDIKFGKVKPEKPKTFLVIYDVKGCGDPTEWFETMAKAKKRARELGVDDKYTNIQFGELKSLYKVLPSVKVSKVKI